jgi:putative hydrolase of HD superfamily
VGLGWLTSGKAGPGLLRPDIWRAYNGLIGPGGSSLSLKAVKIHDAVMKLRGDLVSAARALLSLARSGWMLRGIPGSIAETVAEHSFMSAFICLELADRAGVADPGKLVAYALVHDLGEAFVGDVTKDLSSRIGELKNRIELDFVESEVENELVRKLYREYAEQRSLESRMARLCNYIATYLVGLEYKRMGFEVDDILESTRREVEELSKELGLDHLVRERFLEEQL